ncbi:hypothetical protein V2J09_006082 [Rumex salicifolius]
MNHCAIQRNSRLQEETRSSYAVTATMFLPDHHHLHYRREPVVCPKPRRVAHLAAYSPPSPRSTGWHFSQSAENFDSKAESELLDIILAQDGASSLDTRVAPFFSGSPPSRVSNPLIQDAQFVVEDKEEERLPSPTPVPSSRPFGFGSKPLVRVEGFDCLHRGRSRNCGVLSLA